MSPSIAAVASRHAGWLLSRVGRGKIRPLTNLLAAAFIAIGLPWFVGFDFLSAFVLIPLACLSVFPVADLVVDSFITYVCGVTKEEFAGRIIASVLLGWSFGMGFIAAGLGALNVMRWSGQVLLPSAMVLVDAAVLSLGAAVLTAAVTVRITWKSATSAGAKLAIKMFIVVMTLASMYGCNRWQAEGYFVLTAEKMNWISILAGAAMLAGGVAILEAPTRLRRT